MRVALMQPYLFPYIGYFQLIKNADTFIIYDDVQWIKGGWINRNRILVDGGWEYITLPVQPDSYKKNINERFFSASFDDDKKAIIARIENDYKGAINFEDGISVIKKCFSCGDRNVANFVANTIKIICEYLDINAPIILSSEIKGKKGGIHSQDRVIDIVKKMGGDSYVNAIGGKALYDNKTFLDNNIELLFIDTKFKKYPQNSNEFIEGLSIIDVIMSNSKEEIQKIINSYEVI